MKRFLVIIAILACVGTSYAQQSNFSQIVGIQTSSDGTMFINEPTTTLVVDLTVQQEQVIPGPYARYAQKYLGTRGTLVERTVYDIIDAKISVADFASLMATDNQAKDNIDVFSHMGTQTEFAKILPDRLDNTIISTEDAAEQTAQAIFNIRKHRMELITGEAGENVFGAGLKDALEALQQIEEAYLELFFGKKIVTTTHHRCIIPIEKNLTEYKLIGYNIVTGLEPIDTEDTSIIVLKITPSTTVESLCIKEADPRAKSTIEVLIPNKSKCEVIFDEEVVATEVLPIYEFGKIIKVAR